ncbi:DUF485 domain-containing protein [Staphylococcus massiliensis]|uniref:DUF485 domain-containing protein n=1 Tax=Staphylococcus massiliensis TaxID=555791 RepID=UPI001EDCA5DA|nr:DUF485 domain-containing protein [Staphylococcus massiliensis]MCG3400401.1 DUF485 domain-containing protein [Staphylococcus massiliensis]MCG3401752.1 DUF485 domain-containing protein [Staphylococcus massiliensis]
MTRYDYDKIVQDEAFQNLQKRRNTFIFPFTAFFVVATLLFPILTGYTTILNNVAFWNISYAWLYALMLFIMVWTLVMLYINKAKSFDKASEDIVKRYKKGEIE